ncbi:30S ribosomal protein S3-like [Eriocheir sinensis]|uniref:30S ribosomal protein S3-like n=1 Tax=Eriocheir sinensis TaxID=95602 RepID=UPI0021CA709B|nr:30S ribosomal protein S3-like [Eriocheir sinensis]
MSIPGMTYGAVLNTHANRRRATTKPVAPTTSCLPEKAAQTPADGRSEPHQQKRSRSEESLRETPPAKMPSLVTASGSLEKTRVPAAAAIPALAAPAVSEPVTAAAKGQGAALPAPVSSASAQSMPGAPSVPRSLAASSGWRKVEGCRESPLGAYAHPPPRNYSAIYSPADPTQAPSGVHHSISKTS